jgi:outer membrane protein OmpA-like peptidoglycan-associated protein
MPLAIVRSAALSLAVIGALAAAPARAQDNPSTKEMVQSHIPVRGIRIGKPAPAVSLNVTFATGSAELTPEAIQTLDDLGRALTDPALAAYRFRLEGHTDTVGGRDYNKALSDRRALAVAAYLADRYRVDLNRLQPVGMGQDGLLVPTPDQTAEARNRRVLVVNIGS